MSNNQKYALITGATSGIGYELAKLFAKDQYNLIIVARNRQELEKTSNELKSQYGIEVVTMEKDLSIKEKPFEVYNEVRSLGIEIEVLVNNAGQGQYGAFIHTDINRELEIIQLNIGAYVVLTKCFLQDMVNRKKGKILNVASIASKLPGPLQAVYHGTKAFVHSFNEAIHAEIKDSGVTLTSLLPGATDTDFFHKAEMENSKIVQEGNLADPAEVARDGYKALMDGKDMVVSGLKNKFQVGIGNIMPDSMVAENMLKQQAPANPK
jgi:short-subunit dehydrogenase